MSSARLLAALEAALALVRVDSGRAGRDLGQYLHGTAYREAIIARIRGTPAQVRVS